MITCDEIIDTTISILTKTVTTKTVPAKSNSKNFYILLAFLLIAIALSIAVSIYWCLIKYWTNEKHLLPYHINSKLKEILYW